MKHWKILLVDDSSAMRAFVRRVIQLSGFPVEEFLEAENGQEALACLDSEQVDIVLCDINMPIMNGEQLLTVLAARPEAQLPPIVVISTDSTHTRVTRMMELGARGYLRKPFSPEAMRDTLDQVAAQWEIAAAERQ